MKIFDDETTTPFTAQVYEDPELLTTVGFNGNESPIATLNPLDGVIKEINGAVTLCPLLHDPNKARPAKRDKIIRNLIFNILKINLFVRQ